MTKLTVAITVQSLEQALAASARAAEHGADLVEFRIDAFTDRPAQLPQLVEQSALPCIATCRPTWEGGACGLSDMERVAVLEHACAGARRPAYIDYELAAYQKSPDVRRRVNNLVDHPGQVQPTDTGLILSTHDFEGRPIDMTQRLEAMAAASACRVIKVAWLARSLRDNLEAFEIVMHRYKPTIALCMGDAGLPSRVLAGKFNALLTFAALGPGAGTAIGQPNVADLKGLYRWDAIDAQTRVFGVIGHPIGHSLSPAVHNAGFDAIGFNAVYLPMPVPPEYEHLKATVLSWLDMPELDFRGASVTIPHKENLLRLAKSRAAAGARVEVEPLAERIGAANTLTVRDDGSLYVCNTDYAAALDAVCGALSVEREGLRDKRVAVIGAGGVARAVVAGFAQCGATVVVYNRTLEKAEALASALAGVAAEHHGKVVAAPLEKLCDSCCQVYINCTPIGMHPNVDASPLAGLAGERPRGWSDGAVVFDTIYNPAETRLLREAREAGCRTIAGTQMFVRQAAAQFALWTGQAAPIDVFDQVMTRRLEASGG